MATRPTQTDPYKNFYEDLTKMDTADKLTSIYQNLKDISQKSTDDNIASLENESKKTEETYSDETRSARSSYNKEMNPYGVNRENLFENGLSGSGYSESTMAKNYQSLQNRISSAYETKENAKTQFATAISKAKSEGDSNLAKLALEEYTAKSENLWKMYESKLELENNKLDYDKYFLSLVREDEQEAYERKIDKDVHRKKYR